MTIQKISMGAVKKIAEQYGLTACRVPGTKFVSIRKHGSPKLKDISWEEFESALKDKKLAVYKAENSDFLKIMKDK